MVDQGCHKSVIGGLIESGLDVLFLNRHYSNEFGVYGAIDLHLLKSNLHKFGAKTAAIIVTHPSYDGLPH